MFSYPGILVLFLLAAFLNPFISYALQEPANPSPSNPADNSEITRPAVDSAIKPSRMSLSMNAAIVMAVQRNIDLRVEAQNSRMAAVEAVKSRGVYNPVLNITSTGGVSAVPGEAFFSTKNFNTTVGMTQTLPTGGSITASTQAGYFRFEPAVANSKEWQSTVGLALTQPLLKNAGMETFELNITLAATTHQDSLERFRAATTDTVSNVITAYNRLYVLQKIQETREAALLSAQSLLADIRKKDSESIQGLEIANAEFAIAQRRKDFVEASRSVTDQETNLRYLIGLETPAHIVPSDPPSKNEPTETDEQAVKAALNLRSDLKQLKTGLQTARLQERVARHQSLPELSLNASGGFTGTGYNFTESYQRISSHPGTYWAAGMQFSVPLGNTTARNEYIKSKIRAEQAQDQIKALTWRIRNDIEYDMRALISARLQIQLADKSSQFAEQRLEEYRKNNLLKTASIQDVLNAENDLNVARNAQLEAVESFSNAVVKLWKDTGLLLDRHGVHIDTSRPVSNVESRESNLSLLLDSSEDAGQESGNAAELVPDPSPPSRDAAPAPAEKTAAASLVTTSATAAQTGIPSAAKSYTLYFGEYSSQSVIADSIAKIKSVGLVPQIQQGPQKTEQIFRLYMTEFPNLIQAQKALKKLQQHKASAFILMNEKKRHAVYAGSFADQNAAAAEQARLAGHGIKVRPEKAAISSQTSLLSAGNFQGREAPLEYARKLELMGLKSVLTEKP